MSATYISRAGMQKLHDELKELKKQKTILSGEIGEAREKGDLKENAEYHAAKERLGEVMNRIGKISDALATSRLTDDIEIKKDTVQIGVKVTLQDQDDMEQHEWILVGQAESDPSAGKISVDSPLAQGLLGHMVGETVKIELPAGSTTYKVIKTEPAV
ncbi:MAG: transcription elongation factor GreA [Elusimicrobiota bacterium]